MDEIVYAGADMSAYTKNSNYYLYTNQAYWTLSPYYFDGYGARVFRVKSDGYLYILDYVNDALGVRPVINLRANVTLTGSGTSDAPYLVN